MPGIFYCAFHCTRPYRNNVSSFCSCSPRAVGLGKRWSNTILRVATSPPAIIDWCHLTQFWRKGLAASSEVSNVLQRTCCYEDGAGSNCSQRGESERKKGNMQRSTGSCLLPFTITPSGSRARKPQCLSLDDELALVAFLVGSAKFGLPRTPLQIRSLVETIMRSRGNETSVGRGWWNRFRARHPEVTVRKGQPLSKCRMAATDRQSINEYFDLLEDTLTKNGIADKPANIFNCDETGMQLDHRAPRVVVPLTQKHPYTVTSRCKT
jgi:hypothetical protein